jgi:undecaprenyl diphosphate synthase
MDGNGRWAKSKGMPRNYGHVQGSKNVEKICRAAYHMGIKYLTIYAFSTENWKRPRSEVQALMKILRDYMKSCLSVSKKNNMRVRVIGDISGLEQDLQEGIRKLEKASEGYDGLQFTIAINYGSRDEILRGIRRMVEAKEAGTFSMEDLDEASFGRFLDTKDLPDPDLLIRTSGEQRLSNYLLWQLAYSEFYFTPVPWPEFSEAELKRAVEQFEKRDRRYGDVKEE